MSSIAFPQAHVPVLDQAGRTLIDAPNGVIATFTGEARGYKVTTVTDKADPEHWTITVTVTFSDGPQEVLFLRMDHGRQAYRCSLDDVEWSEMLARAMRNSVRQHAISEPVAPVRQSVKTATQAA